jgi:DNA-binding transcriptional regulator GbsR (MarR family)
MNPKLENIQDKFLESIGRVSDAFGLNGFVAKLYGLLYLHAKPLSLDEMAESLGVSKGNVSLNIRELENWGAVKKVWVKGSRKDFYEADMDIKKILASKLKSAVQKRISEVSLILEEAKKLIQSANGALNEEERAMAKGFEKRLKELDKLKSLASNALSLAEKLL